MKLRLGEWVSGYGIVLGSVRLNVTGLEELADRIYELTQDDFLAGDVKAWAELAPEGDIYVEGRLVVGVLG